MLYNLIMKIMTTTTLYLLMAVGLVSADIMETMILNKNYIGKFKVGKEQVDLKALLNFGATVVNSKTCG